MGYRIFALASLFAFIGAIIVKTKTSKYDVAEHLRTPEEMAAYFEACLEEANGDAALLPKPWEISLVPKA